jgi:hypothetical protein
MSALSDLLDLYSTSSVDAIESDGMLLLQRFRKTTRQELFEVDGYVEAFPTVSAAAVTVESLAARHPDPVSQARESLRLLRRMIDDGEPASKQHATRYLVEHRLHRPWPPAAQALYDRKREMLEWRDFFVSYTNRDAPSTNNQFRQLIRSTFGTAPRGAQNDSNFVAKVITRHLRRYQGLSGFFDESDLQVGDNLQQAIEQYCTRTFAFVQLVEPLSFDREPPINWCFFEFERFTNGTAIRDLVGQMDRHFFLLTAHDLQSLRPANPFGRYQPWLARMDAVLTDHLPLAGERPTTVQAKIQKIATRIVALRTEILDVWLNAD